MPTPLPVLPGVYYCHLTGTYEGLPTGNIFTFKATVAPTDPVTDGDYAQAIANSLPVQWAATVAPGLPDVISGYTAKVYPLGSPTLPARLATTAGGGAVSGPVAPVSAAIVIRHTVLRRGRGSQSHSAISPIAAASVTSDGKSISSGNVTFFTTEFNNFIGGVQADFVSFTGGAGIDYVQLSKKGTGATYPITSSAAESLLGTERSRTPRP
jgi:hypothetical protein